MREWGKRGREGRGRKRRGKRRRKEIESYFYFFPEETAKRMSYYNIVKIYFPLKSTFCLKSHIRVFSFPHHNNRLFKNTNHHKIDLRQNGGFTEIPFLFFLVFLFLIHFRERLWFKKNFPLARGRDSMYLIYFWKLRTRNFNHSFKVLACASYFWIEIGNGKFRSVRNE